MVSRVFFSSSLSLLYCYLRCAIFYSLSSCENGDRQFFFLLLLRFRFCLFSSLHFHLVVHSLFQLSRLINEVVSKRWVGTLVDFVVRRHTHTAYHKCKALKSKRVQTKENRQERERERCGTSQKKMNQVKETICYVCVHVYEKAKEH